MHLLVLVKRVASAMPGLSGNWMSIRKEWLLLYVVTFGAVLPVLFKDCHYNVYSNLAELISGESTSCTERNQSVSRARAQAAKASAYFAGAKPEEVRDALGALANRSSDEQMTVVVVTAAGGPGRGDYLTQTMWKLLSQLTDQQTVSRMNFSLRLMIYNGGEDPALNHAALRLAKYVHVVHGNAQQMRERAAGDKYARESLDYMNCINESLKSSPTYVLVLEDDALPRDDLWTLVEYGISQRLQKYTLGDTVVTDTGNIAYIKLFHPEYAYGYFKYGAHQKFELLGLSMFFGTILALLQEAIVNCLYPGSSREKTYCPLMAWSLYAFLVFLVIGRPCVMELRRYFAPHLYILVPADHLHNTQGLLFTQNGAKALVDRLNKTLETKQHKDRLLWQMLPERNLKAYQLYPNALRHIGYRSTKGDISRVDPF